MDEIVYEKHPLACFGTHLIFVMRARTGCTDFGGTRAGPRGGRAELSDLVNAGEGFHADKCATQLSNSERYRNRAARRRNRHRHELLERATVDSQRPH